MSNYLIGIIGVVYGVVAIDLYRQGKFDLALMFVGYCVAQWGVLWAASK
jgi:hypothetical protein